MSQNSISHLSYKRIIISLLVFLLIPFAERLLDLWVNNPTISYTFVLNLAGCILIIYDWNLFGIHYNRFKAKPGDCILYTIIGLLLVGAWTKFNTSFLGGYTLVPDHETVNEYAFAAPAILIAFTYIHASIYNIAFKCLTDHFDIREKELLIILASGFLFGLIYTLAFIPEFKLDLLVRTYLYHVVLTAILSYLYNQSSTFLTGILSLGTISLIAYFFF